MKSAGRVFQWLLGAWTGLHLSSAAAAPPEAELAISALTSPIEAENTAVYYPDANDDEPLLVGTDGSAARGGFGLWTLKGDQWSLKKIAERRTGRSKLVATLYDIAGKDLLVTIAQPDSILRLFELDGVTERAGARTWSLGDWSALCPWRSPESGEQYVFLFGKRQAVQFLVRGGRKGFTFIEVSDPRDPSRWKFRAVAECLTAKTGPNL